jgi:alpha-galactosidase
MRAFFLTTTLAMVFTAAFAAAADEAYVRPASDGRSWSIGNGLIERVVRFDEETGLRTASWRNKVTGREFLASEPEHSGEEFSFNLDGKPLAGASDAWTLLGAETGSLNPPGNLLTVKLRARGLPLDVTVFYAVYAGHPVIRKWISLTNRGTESMVITHLIFEAVNIRPGKPDGLQVSAFYGVQPREIFFTGRVEDSAIVERNSRTGEGFIVMNEAPGYTKRTETGGWGGTLQVMYDTDLFPFERALAPGETFESARSSILFFADGKGFSDPHWSMPTYTSEVLFKKGPRYQPPWVFNTWEPFQRGINDSITRSLIDDAGRMGMDIFTIDDGWQAAYGSNEINKQAFPRGLDSIQADVESKGMRLGLWVPLAAISVNTEAYKQHPEWVCRDQNGRPKFTGTMAGQSAVMCMASPYRDVAAQRINDLISRYHLRYVKIDLTTVFNAYGEAPGCYASGHYHRDWAQSLEGIYEGIAYVTAAIYRQHPDVLLDLTFELWGQKHVIDYGLLAAGDLDWLSNVDDYTPESAGPRQARTLLYHRALAIPTEAMLIGNLHANTPPIEDRLATAMGSAPLFLGDLRKLTDQELGWYSGKIGWFKKLRQRVPINQGFFPLGDWMQPGIVTWDGFARLSRGGEGLISIFRNESGLQSVNLRIPVYPEGTYDVRSEMTGQIAGTFSGDQLRSGIDLKLSPNYRAEVFQVSKKEGR